MTAVLPDDPAAFIARAERATNNADTEWPMTIYAPSIRLELFGDGLHDVYEGTDAVRPAIETIYDWFQAIDGRLSKTLVSASGDAVVNTWEGTLFGGRHTTRGAELWYFDETGQVVRNVLYQSLDAKPLRHPMTAVRAFLNPRPALAFLTARARHRARRPALN